MTPHLPACLVGTTRVAASARPAFGEFLDGASGGLRGTLLTEGSTWVWETLRQSGRKDHWDVWAIVPHVAGYVREVTDYGMFGAGWRRLRRINPLSGGRLFVQGMLNAPGVLRKDFPTLLTLLLELEMANFRKARPAVVFLHPQMTDLLLAMDNGPALKRAIERIQKGFGAEAGLSTYNAGTLLPRLEAWGVNVPYLLTAIHPRGFGMRPDRESCERSFRAFKGKILATCETPLDNGIATYWKERGVAAAVYEALEPNITEWRSWLGWRSPGTGPTLQPKTQSFGAKP